MRMYKLGLVTLVSYEQPKSSHQAAPRVKRLASLIRYSASGLGMGYLFLSRVRGRGEDLLRVMEVIGTHPSGRWGRGRWFRHGVVGRRKG
jgi:hypothetical protein